MAQIAIIGAGPAGLIAAEFLGRAGHAVTVYDHTPSPGRKFLLAGRSGLNLTHSEDLGDFFMRYGAASCWLRPCIEAFTPADLRSWCHGLGQTLFVGSSGRVFPTAIKAAPLLRAWLRRLDGSGVRFAPRHRWCGFEASGALRFETADGVVSAAAEGVLLALGGASWPRMGADGGWVPVLREIGIGVADLRPSNCGVVVPWSTVFASRFEGQPLKRIALSIGGKTVRGEAVVTRYGLEGGAVYSVSALLREALLQGAGTARLSLDLRPDLSLAHMAARVDGARQGRSLSNFLRQQAGLAAVAIGLVQEVAHAGEFVEPLSQLLKGNRCESLQDLGLTAGWRVSATRFGIQ